MPRSFRIRFALFVFPIRYSLFAIRPIPENSMANVTLRSVRKAYPNGFEAIKGVDVDVADGQFCVLVGPSGCGKSTLLRMVAGLETITDGEIAIGGRRVNEVEPKDRNIAMVFQNYALYPHMSVYENMSYGLRIRRLPPERIRE